jgi:hypothetical protein
MVRANRKLTGAALLASYLAAMIGAWSHGRHDCRELNRGSNTAAPRVCYDHGCEVAADQAAHHSCRDSSAQDQESSDSQIAVRPQGEAHSHHIDQCLICQFLAIQKVMELSGGSIPTAKALAQRLVQPDHRLLVAERFGTPDSRGPPRAC